MEDYKKLSEIALNLTKDKGATYADVRVERIEDEDLSVKNQTPELIQKSSDFGFGIRVIVDGAWGFAASADLNEDNIKKISLQATDIAKASSRLKKKDVILSPLEKTIDSYKTPIIQDPFTIPLKEKLDYLLFLDSLMRKVSGINLTEAWMGFRKWNKFFASSEGSTIEQEIIQSGAGISATAMKTHREMGTRSYPNSSGQWETKGYELIKELNFEGNAKKIAEEAVALLFAKECPSKTTTIILDGPQMSLQIHESIGHPLELDRVFGVERNFSGTSFATTDKLDKLKYGSEIVNVTNDPTSPSGLGTFGYDDEGTKAHKSYVIKNGILTGYLSSRETAARINRQSSSAARSESWGYPPICRMTNTNLLPGDKTLEEMISEVDEGIYMKTVRTWSIDDNRENFQMGCEIGWEIKNGRLGEMIKNPSYSGNSVEFWNFCDAIANEKYWKVWGTPNCAKGQPAQNARVGQGSSPARFRNVKVGSQ
ncbi:MAG: TldD/PmbA family protein [candidate division Zixibacteria bacterium]|nr:TldD/PmbA family protein [candidate division Zixibacteria bacterium]